MNTVTNISPSTHKEIMNFVFENQSEETAIYLLTVREIAEGSDSGQNTRQTCFAQKIQPQLIDVIQFLCKDDKLVIPKELQQYTVE